MSCFLFSECGEKKAYWAIVAVFLISIPQQWSFAFLIRNILIVGSGFVVLYALSKLLNIEGYVGLCGYIISVVGVLVSLLLFLDRLLGFGGVVSEAIATIITYYVIVLLAYHAERIKGSPLFGMFFLGYWFLFHFWLLRLIL